MIYFYIFHNEEFWGVYEFDEFFNNNMAAAFFRIPAFRVYRVVS